jgi:hypothetical protein
VQAVGKPIQRLVLAGLRDVEDVADAHGDGADAFVRHTHRVVIGAGDSGGQGDAGDEAAKSGSWHQG